MLLKVCVTTELLDWLQRLAVLVTAMHTGELATIMQTAPGAPSCGAEASDTAESDLAAPTAGSSPSIAAAEAGAGGVAPCIVQLRLPLPGGSVRKRGLLQVEMDDGTTYSLRTGCQCIPRGNIAE